MPQAEHTVPSQWKDDPRLICNCQSGVMASIPLEFPEHTTSWKQRRQPIFPQVAGTAFSVLHFLVHGLSPYYLTMLAIFNLL